MADLRIYSDLEAMSQAAAQYVAAAAESVLASFDSFGLMLAGGSTPRAVHAHLSQEPLRGAIDWQRTNIFWGDERCVPADHADSNYRMARETLLEHVPIPEGNLHRIRGELNPQEAAAQYEREIQGFFEAGGRRSFFDLIMLGMGRDAHTASLFPGTPWVEEIDRLVVPVEHSGPPAPEVNRVSVTPALINTASRVAFIVSGEGKADALAQVINGPHQPKKYPSQVVDPENGELVWFVDQAAASQLWETG